MFFCCTIVPCLVLNHGTFQHSQLVLLSVAVSSCIYLCVFHRLNFCASDVSFAPSPAVGAPVVHAAVVVFVVALFVFVVAVVVVLGFVSVVVAVVVVSVFFYPFDVF